MCLKVFLLFGALCTLQVRCQTLKDGTIDDQLLSNLETLLDVVTNTISVVCNVGKSFIDILKGDTTSTLLADITGKIMDKVITHIQSGIEDIEQANLTSDSVEILECLKNTTTDISEEVVTVVSTFSNCTVSNLTEVLNATDVILDVLLKKDDEIKDLKQDLAACANSSDRSECLEGFKTELLNHLLDLPFTLVGDVQAVLAKVTAANPNLSSCLKDAVTAIKTAEENIENAANICYNEVNHGKIYVFDILLEVVTNEVIRLVDLAQNIVSQLSKNAIVKNVIVLATQSQFKDITDENSAKLTQLNATSDKLDCLKNGTQALETSLNEAIDTFGNCSTKDIYVLLEDVALLFGNISANSKDVKSFEPELLKCTTADNMTLCIESFEQKVYQSMSNNIQDNVSGMIQKALVVGTDFGTCLVSGKLNLNETQGTIVKSAKTCMEQSDGKTGASVVHLPSAVMLVLVLVSFLY